MADTPSWGQPRELIVTVYDLYATEPGGWLTIAALVDLLAVAGIDEPAVRSATSRLKRRQVLVASRRGGVAGYALSDSARTGLCEERECLSLPPSSALDDGWLLVVFSIPEAERLRRHALRAQLATMGFGAAAAGVRIAPAHRYDATRAVLSRLGLESYVDLYRADYLDFGDVRSLSGQWWDLAPVQRSYMDFLGTWRPVLTRWQAVPEPASGSGAAAFADWVRVSAAWRRLPYGDPGLPAELLPADWPRPAAVELFRALERRLAATARGYATTMLGSPRIRGEVGPSRPADEGGSR